MASIDDKTVAEFEAKYGTGKILHLKRHGEEALFRRPNREEWRLFMTQIHDEDTRADAIERLAVKCCVYPDSSELNRILDDKPGLAQSWGNEVSSFAGMGRAETVKK